LHHGPHRLSAESLVAPSVSESNFKSRGIMCITDVGRVGNLPILAMIRLKRAAGRSE